RIGFRKEKQQLPPTWKQFSSFQSAVEIFLPSATVEAHKEVALLIRGTDNLANIRTDIWFALTSLLGWKYTNFPGLEEALQIGKAIHNVSHRLPIDMSPIITEAFVEELKKLRIMSFTIIGHSLGGLLTEMVAVKLGVRGETFDSPGSRASSVLTEEEYQIARKEGRVKVNNYFSTPHVINTVNSHSGLLYQLPIPDTFLIDQKLLQPRRNLFARFRRKMRYLKYGVQWTLERHSIATFVAHLRGLPAERVEQEVWPTLPRPKGNLKDAWYLLIGKYQREQCFFEGGQPEEIGTTTTVEDFSSGAKQSLLTSPAEGGRNSGLIMAGSEHICADCNVIVPGDEVIRLSRWPMPGQVPSATNCLTIFGAVSAHFSFRH
ncbi:hypothetical protein BV898_16863, partial [Hypsibius exemplaris]